MKKIIVGRFGKIHGLKGWVSVISFTEPPENIIAFNPWFIKKQDIWQVVNIENSRTMNDKVLVKIKDVDDCDAAKVYTNIDISIERGQLPHLPTGQYYWADLEGLTVIDQSGGELGIIAHLLATGSNDVIVVKNKDKELLIPYLKNIIVKVDLENKVIKVDYEI